ncbi:hypothetical protein BU16DRAFT_573078 [Lophium mytilinum]|uniref:Uncharacterized protein n=1 Tax=Lophium mytilinum TaxID=390894 RepID=A0A6A6QSJ0_9PEZI|nr:hypothetical protein BU16DRAFT_573078 [Lophium mytilinum]
MSLRMYGGSGNPQLYTMVTTRTLNVLYGVSNLCALIKNFKLDGVARMNAGFEVMLCDLVVAGVTQLEEDPTLPQNPKRVPPFGFGNDFAPQNSWEWIRSGTWYYGTSATDAGSTRETRIQLDLCGFMSLLRPMPQQFEWTSPWGVRGNDTYQNGWGLRRGHRLLGISREDISTMKKWLKPITTAHALTETITNQHRSRAREISVALRNGPQDSDSIQPIIKTIHELSYAILYTYLQYPSAAKISSQEARNLTIARCSSVYTENIKPSSLNEFEVIIKESIRIVMAELCSWEWHLFEWSEKHTTNLIDPENELELCYIPMWPVIHAPGKHQGGFYADDSYTEEEMYDFWRPWCLNRTLFDRGGGRAREPAHQIPDAPNNLPVLTSS